MNFYQKLLATLIFSLSLTSFVAQPSQVLSEPLNRREIRKLAKSITVKIVDADTMINGSGVIFDYENGIYSVLTNQHVAGSNSNYEIHTPDGKKHQISFKEEIPGLDLMVVQFKSEALYEVAELGNSEEIAELELIYVSGYPAIQADLDIVDGKIRSIRQDVLKNPQTKQGYALVYTNETLPGSSGGAILDEQGYLVGINGEAERDITSGRDISRGIPINLFISLSFNYLPENQLETENKSEEEYEQENYSESGQPVAYLPNVVGNSNYSLAFNFSQDEDSAIKSVAITPNGQTVVTGDNEGKIQVWHGLTGQLEKTFASDKDGVKSVAISADGDTIVSGGEDNSIKVWNRRSGQLERTLTGHEEEINSIVLSDNGQTIVSGSNDRTIKIWNRYSGQLERSMEAHEAAVKSVAISSYANTIVSGGQDKVVKIWDLRSGKLRKAIKAHKEEVRSVAISVDGRTIVSGSGDKTIKLWDVYGNHKHTFRGHESKVDSVAIGGDGRSIISGSRDRTIKIWDLQTLALEQNLTTEDSSKINSIAASANSQILVSGGKDSTLSIWHLKR
ncbi:MAG: trypsin-like peptidase domain-containing protein [Cyanobacteria bacterium P01_G01_bin.19]